MAKRTATVRLANSTEIYFRIVASASHRALAKIGPDVDVQRLFGAARSRNVRVMIEAAESLEIQQYSSELDQFVKTQLVALVKKFPFTRSELPGFNPEAAAWKKFLAAEHRCKRVNQRSSLLHHGVGFPYGDMVVSMRKYVRRVLGSTPNLPRIYALCDWGPGANVGVTGDRTNLARKFLARQWTVTPLALSYATQALWSHDQLRRLILPGKGDIVCLDRDLFSDLVKSRCALVTYNNVSFVPKTFKTHRSIASEPLLNGFLQKGVDNYMRERLTAFAGIDLQDQEPNKLMARTGSCTEVNPWCTIDLSSASDSISVGLAKTLLPPDWFELLNSLRSHQYNYRGQVHTYQKFVSMGNGFCFPLQTVLFAAVCHAVSEVAEAAETFRVYGDDIIVRQSGALLAIELLRYLGFRTNTDKTNVVGPFRESCGADWYSGQDIRPVYVDYRFESNQDLYKFHNSTLRSERTMEFFSYVREDLRNTCPKEVRFVRPVHGNADSCFTTGRDEVLSSEHTSWDRRTWAWRWREVLTTPVRDKLEGLDPKICNVLEYLAVLRGSTSSSPLAIRRKTRARVRNVSYWGLPGSIPWVGADPDRGETPY
jgi:hypothetical protein